MTATATETWIPTETFGERLRRVRRAKHWTIHDMAEALGVPEKRYGNWELGTQPRDVADVARHVQAVTGADAGWLLLGDSMSSNNKCLDGSELAFSSQLELDLPAPFDHAHAA